MNDLEKAIDKSLGIAKRAVHIAAVIMQAADLCRYESFSECTKRRIDEKTCVDCIEEWLLEKAEWEENNL